MAIAKKSTPTLECMEVPPWLEVLLSTIFFTACEVHTQESRNECKMLCLDCTDYEPSCVHCINSSHQGHRVIQIRAYRDIRRSSYHDVVRVTEIQKAVDLTAIQTYVINGSRVIFLNTRAPTNHKPKTGGKNCSKIIHTNCLTCTRNLIDPYHFCSLECKLEWTKKMESESFVDGGGIGTKKKEKSIREVNSSNYTQGSRPINSNSRKRKGIPRRAPLS